MVACVFLPLAVCFIRYACRRARYCVTKPSSKKRYPIFFIGIGKKKNLNDFFYVTLIPPCHSLKYSEIPIRRNKPDVFHFFFILQEEVFFSWDCKCVYMYLCVSVCYVYCCICIYVRVCYRERRIHTCLFLVVMLALCVPTLPHFPRRRSSPKLNRKS